MSDAWMPGVGHLRAAADGGHLRGGAPRAVWQALGADPHTVSARSAAQRLCELGRASHLTWNPLSGEIIQLVSVLRAGRGLGAPETMAPAAAPSPEDAAGHTPAPGPAQAGPLPPVNSEGRVCVQVCVVAFAWEPFTSGPMNGLDQIMDWLDSWGIPRCWPAGIPAAFPHGHASGGSRRLVGPGRSFRRLPGAGLAGGRAGRHRCGPAHRRAVRHQCSRTIGRALKGRRAPPGRCPAGRHPAGRHPRGRRPAGRTGRPAGPPPHPVGLTDPRALTPSGRSRSRGARRRRPSAGPAVSRRTPAPGRRWPPGRRSSAPASGR